MKRRNFIKALGAIGIAATMPIVTKSKDYFKGVEEAVGVEELSSPEWDGKNPLFVLIDSNRTILAKGLIRGINVEQEQIDVSSLEEGYHNYRATGGRTVELNSLAVEYDDFRLVRDKFRDCEKLGIAILFDENTEMRCLCSITSMSLRIKTEEPIFHKITLMLHNNLKKQKNGERIFRKAFGLGEKS